MNGSSSRYARIVVPVAILALTLAGTLGAQAAEEPQKKDGKGSTAPTSCTKTTAGPSPTVQDISVEDVYKFGHAKPDDPDRDRAGIRDLVVVNVKALCLLMDQAKCLGSYANPSCKAQDIALYLDGREIKGLAPESGAPRADVETLQFRLNRSAASDAQWADLLGGPKIGEKFFERPVAISVGLPGEGPVATKVQSFKLIRIRALWFVLCSIILVVALGALGVCAQRSALLRYADKTSSFSLARCQMAFWFILIIASFSFIWLITGAVDIMTNTALILIGIGAGTALGGTVIDRSKEQKSKTELEKVVVDKGKLENDVKNLDARAKAAGVTPSELLVLEREKGEKSVLLEAADKRTKELNAKMTVSKSVGFWEDVLSDQEGIEFHRFQMLFWMLVLGVVFLQSVWVRLAMPEFDATLLTLLGISSGTYLGFKIPER